MISDTLLQNGNEYYKLVERSEINKIIEELKFSNSGLVNKKDVINFGKLIGASAILTGTINISKVEDTMFKEQRSECIKSKKSKLKTPLGNIPVSKCLKWRYYDVNCQKRTATFSATTKIIEVETETIIYSSDYTETAKSAACPDSGYPVKSSAELLTIAQNKVLEDIRRDILPYKVILTIELKDNDDDIKDKNAKKYFRAGLEFTSNNRIDRACELWEQAYQINPQSVSLLYNLGVCKEVYQNYLEAKTYYQKADHLLLKPDPMVNKALKRIEAVAQ